MHTQVRLLRVLESGEFMKVGSSEVQKTDVRIIAATNVNVLDAVAKGKFREDLYYRLNTVEITLPALRKRKGDISLLFRKFAIDFAEKYHRPVIRLNSDAERIIESYAWPGNIRQLRNFTEEISVVENDREIDAQEIQRFLPTHSIIPVSAGVEGVSSSEFNTEREILYKFLFDMKKDLHDLRSLTMQLLTKNGNEVVAENKELVNRIFNCDNLPKPDSLLHYEPQTITNPTYSDIEDYDYEDINENESLSLQDNEMELIEKALEKHHGRRKDAAGDLGISERTLYRKIKQYGL